MQIVAKTPETLDVAARRRIANEPLQYIPTAAAATVLDAIEAVALLTYGERFPLVDGRPRRQRYVGMLSVRAVAGLDDLAFGWAMVELADAHAVWVRVGRETTAEQDAASVRIVGTDYHEVTGDSWR